MNNRFSREQVDQYIRERRFSELFVGHGWDKENLPSAPLVLNLRDERQFSIDRVVEKRGFAVCVCVCDAGTNYPEHKSDRQQLVNQLARHHYEHLLIICGEDRQCWAVAIRPQNRPHRTVEVEWNTNQDIQPLMEKLDGMIFDISEEEGIAITDVVDRVRTAFMENSENVTREFYGEFREELSAFSEFIEGIQERVSRDWYAALMLNRLMFIYFIQKKHFLAGDPNYLERRLRKTQEKYGDDTFHNRFYRHFLRRLFSEGLGTPPSRRNAELKKMLGKVPYLNGGLFDLHDIEEQNANINIKDLAFKNLFDFFGKYNWHLDTRATATGKDINPDVIGYIFEKYINDRAAKGAYYTQEDITGYITRNTVIPFLLNKAKEKCENAFDAKNGIWRFLRENPDNYIYDAVKKGCGLPDEKIPENIRQGMDTKAPDLMQRRKDWNTKTPEHFALPTEIWRETMARRTRYCELKTKITNGEIHEIDDLITYNLDIERFASDVLRYYEGSDFITPFYEAIAGRKALKSNQKGTRGITVLDPACGSGAFLFAALNILEPLYEICIERMREFVKEDDEARAQGKRKGTKKHPQFRVVLEEIESHPNEKYWIYKTIILNNLYGVDLMREAAEIAKLRLFLKLAATAEYDKNKDNLGLEPLPDIDFNIRSGNSLVGFVSMAQFEKAISIDPQTGQQRMDYGGLTDEVREQAGEVQKANDAFRAAQDAGSEGYQEAKRELTQRLDALNDRMNHYLAECQYRAKNKGDIKRWTESHQPFHWLAEFYGIIKEDGFDVVVGNPPYVKYSKVKETYTVRNYKTESCRDLYAFFMEAATSIRKKSSYFGMIIPVSLMSANRMQIARNIYSTHSIYASGFSDRPTSLFVGVHQMLSIVIASPNTDAGYTSCGFHHWYAEERDKLFPLLAYQTNQVQISGIWHKISSSIEEAILEKISMHKKPLTSYFQKSGELISICSGTGGYWLRTFDQKVSSTEYKRCFVSDKHVRCLCAILNSSLFYWFWRKCSNSRHLDKKDMQKFTFDQNDLHGVLEQAGKEHLVALKASLEFREGDNSYEQYRGHRAKKEVDAIDRILAECYQLTQEELDYIINYDIKYRMGLGG